MEGDVQVRGGRNQTAAAMYVDVNTAMCNDVGGIETETIYH